MLLRTEEWGSGSGATPSLISFYSGDPRRFYSSTYGDILVARG